MGIKEDLIGTALDDLETLENMETEFNLNGANETRASIVNIKKPGGAAEKQTMKIDEIFKKCGGFGRYQVFLIICLGLGGALYVSIQNLSMTFVESSAPWVCLTENCVTRTGVNRTGILTNDMAVLCSANLTKKVDWKWADANHTAVSDFDQACGSQTIVTNVLYFCPGVMIGGIIFGMMGWSTGRKTPFLSALLTSMVASVISAASREYILFLVLRVLLGASIGGYELLYFCWIVELVSKRWRPIAVGIQGIFWAAGLLIVVYVNQTWEYWRYKMVYVGIVSLIFIFVYAAVPESPYWLLAKGQDDVAVMVLKKISILNGKNYPDSPITIPSIKTREKAVSFFQTRFKRVGAYLCLNWFFVGMVYYYIYLSLDTLGTPVEGISKASMTQTNYIVAVGVELPAAIFGAALLCFFLGRKLSFMINLGIFTVCIAISLLQIPVYAGWNVRRGMVLIGAKFAITGAKLILALWTAEIAPTTIRTLFYGLCLGAASFGVVVSSSLVYFSAEPLISVILFGSMAILCGLGTTQIKDTSNWDLPDHLFDVYKYMNNEDAVYSDLQSEPMQAGTVL